MTHNQPQTIVFFDGSCPLCKTEIDIYRRRDNAEHLNLVDVSKPTASLPSALDAPAAMARFHVLTGDGELLSGARAFAHVWQLLPGWRLPGRIAQLPGIVHGLELLYRLSLKGRPQLVRLFLAMSGGSKGS